MNTSNSETRAPIAIRPTQEADFEKIWPIFHQVVSQGTTYPYAMDTNRDQAHHLWMELPTATYVALIDEQIRGTYYIKPNQPGYGSHVCNAGFMVSQAAWGQGLGSAMVNHSLQEARHLGFKAMQFNAVVSTNTRAIALWTRSGFETIGILPKAFNHQQLGLVDLLVMYQWLGD
jgi:L-amino acid N-acyltransferase YncA